MTTFAQRRWRNLALALFIGGLIWTVDRLYDMSLRDAAFLNGWLLMGGMVFLAAFNGRKKIYGLPALPLSAWLQAHIYVGCLCALLFLLHTDFVLPNGTLETVLWLLFVAMVASGMLGLLLSRILPHRLSRRGERVIFERIPGYRSQLAHRAETLAINAVKETGASIIADFYADELAKYLLRPQSVLGVVLGSHRSERRLRAKVQELERYLDERGREVLADLNEIISAKADLDYQRAMQLILKSWLFVHIPLNYGLMLFTIAHIVVVYAFAAGAP